MKVLRTPQHFIDWSAVGGYKKFMEDYKNAPTYQDKRILIESLPMQTNPEWLEARRQHITASKMKDFLGMDRSGKKPGESYKKVVKQLVAEMFGWEEAEKTYSEKASIKRGLVFERRARELFTQATGIELKSDIGFISEDIDGLPFGYSPDAYAGDADKQDFSCLAEIKSFELMGIQDEIEQLHTLEVCEQMQGAMKVANCPRCYKILYCAELDKIFYLDYTRGLDFSRRLSDRIQIAKEYMQDKINDLLNYSDLKEKIMAE